MGKPLISICLPSNRPHYWKELCDSYKPCSEIDFEILVVGPNDPICELPSFFKHIKTNNIKPPQCVEVSIREAQGDFITFTGDDTYIMDSTLDDFYLKYLELADIIGNEKFYLAPKFRYGTTKHSTPYRRKLKPVPKTSLNGVIIRKKWIDQIGSIDRRFLSIYWDIDLAMRLYEIDVIPSPVRLSITENRDKNVRGKRLCSVSSNYDREVVDSFWVRDREEGEEVPSDTAWCCFFREDKVLSKYRTKEVEGFEDDGIKLKSQGIKKLNRRLQWE